MEHFGAAFKLDSTEETRTQLQEEATPMTIHSVRCKPHVLRRHIGTLLK